MLYEGNIFEPTYRQVGAFDEKVLTELKVDLRFVRRMNEPNQSGLLLANNFK